MKIITRGTPPRKYRWIGRWRCSGCRSIIELEESDDETLKPMFSDDQREGPLVTFVCPVCERERPMWRVQ